MCRHVGGSVYLRRLLRWSLQGLSVFWEKSFFGAPTVYSFLAQDGEGHWVLDHDSDTSQRVNFNPESPTPGHEDVTLHFLLLVYFAWSSCCGMGWDPCGSPPQLCDVSPGPQHTAVRRSLGWILPRLFLPWEVLICVGLGLGQV